MAWTVAYHDEYWAELQLETEAVQDAVIAIAELLEHSGPLLKRPYADTLNGSRFPNMKQLRITLPDGEWRVAYAFDPARQAILLTGASKSGISSKQFYARLVRTADERFANHLAQLKEKGR
jgi:hypothetical protein